MVPPERRNMTERSPTRTSQKEREPCMEEDLSIEKLESSSSNILFMKAPSKQDSAPKLPVMQGAESRMMVPFILGQEYFIITLITVISFSLWRQNQF